MTHPYTHTERRAPRARRVSLEEIRARGDQPSLLLFGGALLPLTSVVTFAKAPPDAVTGALESLPAFREGVVRADRAGGPHGIRESLAELPPVTRGWERLAVIECVGGWTAVFSNEAEFFDAKTLGDDLADSGVADAVLSAVALPRTIRRVGPHEPVRHHDLDSSVAGWLGATSLVVRVDGARASIRRYWEPHAVVFEQAGDEVLLPLREPRAGFDELQLDQELASYGVQMFNEAFYARPHALLSRPSPISALPFTASLEDLQARL